MMSLNVKAWLGFVCLVVVVSVLLFAAAGTVHYWQGWLFLAVFFGAALIHTVYAIKHDPALLRRRLKGGPWAEKEAAQKIIMVFVSLGFIALMVVPALDHRFSWSGMPLAIVIAGDVLVAIGFAIVFAVFRENSFAAATVEVAPENKLVSTGPYAHIRHPQYAGSLLYLLGTPLALGSYWGLLAFGLMTAALIWRLFDEEGVLERDLPGYAQYRQRVRWRLIPGIF